MKISCPSCQSKYTIADEKVQGRSVKVRCRKCGETIQVGEGGIVGSTPSEAGAVPDNVDTGGAAYSVLIAEGDQRDMTLEEIVSGYNSGVLTGDTFVWADGQSDWMALSQVQSIVQALNAASEAVDRQRAAADAEPPPAAAPKAATSTPVGAGSLFSATKTPVEAPPAASMFGSATASPVAAGSMFGGASASPAAGSMFGGASASPAAGSMFGGASASPPVDQAAVDRRSPKADLFGSARSAGSEEEIATSAPQLGAVVSPKMTGSREEASVLFSLSALTASATTSSSGTFSQASAGGASDDSGLIDLRALANKADQPKTTAAAPAPIAILDAAPLLGTPLLDVSSSPVNEPEPEKKASKMPIFLGVGVAFAGVVIALAIILTRKPPPVVAPAVPTATETAAASTPPPQPLDSSAAAPATGAPSASAPKAAVGKPGTGKGKPGAAKVDDKASTPAVPAATTAKKPAASPCGCAPADLGCAMRCSATGKK